MQLELKYLVGYANHNLKIQIQEVGESAFISELEGIDFKTKRIIAKEYNSSLYWKLTEIKPILYPLSMITKEIEINGEMIVPIEWFIKEDWYGCYELERMNNQNFINLNTLPYCITEQLLEWHFDIYGLIEAGLAIDKTTIT
jgi:hypothetical protein